MVASNTAILWVRNDYRLRDNEALLAASTFDELMIVFIDDDTDLTHKIGRASQWWLYYTLKMFRQQLQSYGSDISFFKGHTAKVFEDIFSKKKVNTLLFNRSHDPLEAKKVKLVMSVCKKHDVEMKSFQGNVLCHTDKLLKKDGTPYLVYTPFWKNFLTCYEPKKMSLPRRLPSSFKKSSFKYRCTLDDLGLLPKRSWHKKFDQYWQVGEEAALKKLKLFINKDILLYKKQRDYPAIQGTSLLSPHLHFGEIHPQRILSMIQDRYGELRSLKDESVVQFSKEILWREFSYHLIQHIPKLVSDPLRPAFNAFPWKKNNVWFDAWCKGKTGYPIVDAGMRQLWEMGWMHNRVRMIVASFLIKHLNISWKEGASWFWDTLVDADMASNTQGWQWTAGCGADAAPFFRIFNPITQAEKFDPNGKYIARWCPELSVLPLKWRFRPWEAPKDVCGKAKFIMGKTYPRPIVDHAQARKQALDHYQRIK